MDDTTSVHKDNKRHAIVWISVIVGFLALMVVIQGTLLVFALNDPSFAVEPDYEQKAANWDTIREEQAASDRLGWDVQLKTNVTADPGMVDLTLTALDSGGLPVAGASVAFEAFYNARASRIVRGEMTEIGDGQYGGAFEAQTLGCLGVPGHDHTRRTDLRRKVPQERPESPGDALGAVMLALVATVFVASLLGSLHCAGMCGVFVAFAVDPRGNDSSRRVLLQLAYNGGRLVTYTALGALAGWAGAALDLGGALFGIQRAALVTAGLAMIVFGGVTLLRLLGVKIAAVAPPKLMRTAFARLQYQIRERGPVVRALGTGLFSTFLPCGWLYAFAVAAAGTGSAALGAATMALFWTGTLPVMVALGTGVQQLAGPLRRHVPALTALALVLVGLAAVSGRFEVPALTVATEAVAVEPAGVEETIRRVEALGDSPPNCHDDAR